MADKKIVEKEPTPEETSYYWQMVDAVMNSELMKKAAARMDAKLFVSTAAGAGVGAAVAGPIGAVFGTSVGFLVGLLCVDGWGAVMEFLKDLTSSLWSFVVDAVTSLVGSISFESFLGFILIPENATKITKLLTRLAELLKSHLKQHQH